MTLRRRSALAVAFRCDGSSDSELIEAAVIFDGPLALAQALTATASPYELHVMEGLPHGFMQMSALEGCRAAMRLMWDFLARNV